jgi:hypothetical protein
MTDIARSGSVILGHFTFFGGGGGSSNINKIRFDRLGVNRFRSSWDEVPKECSWVLSFERRGPRQYHRAE